jgi:hypothetical protein
MARMAETDEAFLRESPRRVRVVVDINRPVASVWDELVGDDPMSFCGGITAIRWTSARPFGVGTTRTATVLRLLRVRERYVSWDDLHRKVFVGVGANLPVLRRFAEEYVVEPRDDDGCRFIWTAAWEPSAGTRFANRLNYAIFTWFARDIERHFSPRDR